MKAINPYINFDGNSEEAFAFYQSIFGGKLSVARFKDFDNTMGVAEENLEKVANIGLTLDNGTTLLGDDGMAAMGQTLERGNGFSINIEAESAEEADKLFSGLSEGGTVSMPLDETEWAEKFGMLTDKFGITWSIMYAGAKGESFSAS